MEWNEAFFNEFSSAFAKFKNALIECHLNEEQIKTLQEKLASALSSLQDKLDTMYSDFLKDKEESEEEKK